MLVKVDLKEILAFVSDGEDCKIEIDKDGDYAVLPAEAFGYQDTILKQRLDAYDYEECDNEEHYIDWLISCYDNEELEAKDGQYIEIEFVR